MHEFNPDLMNKWDKLKVDKEKLEKELLEFKEHIESFLSDKGIKALNEDFNESEKLSEKAEILGEWYDSVVEMFKLDVVADKIGKEINA